MPAPGQRTHELNRHGEDGWELCAEGDGLFTFKRPVKVLTPEEHAIKALAIESIPARRAYLYDLKPEMKAKVKEAMEGLRRAATPEAPTQEWYQEALKEVLDHEAREAVAEAQRRYDALSAITEAQRNRQLRHLRNIHAWMKADNDKQPTLDPDSLAAYGVSVETAIRRLENKDRISTTTASNLRELAHYFSKAWRPGATGQTREWVNNLQEIAQMWADGYEAASKFIQDTLAAKHRDIKELPLTQTQRRVLKNIRGWLDRQLGGGQSARMYTDGEISSFKVWKSVLEAVLKAPVEKFEVKPEAFEALRKHPQEAPGWAKDDVPCRHCGKPIFSATDQPSGKTSWRHRMPNGWYYYCGEGEHKPFAEPVIHPPTQKPLKTCVHCGCEIIQLGATWVHKLFGAPQCGSGTNAKPTLQPWTGDMPLGALCLGLVSTWARLNSETRKDLWNAITAFQDGEELMGRAGLKI
jgi:hypothetical protein